MADNEMLLTLTADIIAAHVSNNSVAVNDVPGAIKCVYAALAKLGQTDEPEPKPQGAVSLKASIKPDYLVSMIDGKQYKMLKRHLAQNGHTPQSYREAFGLPVDYPMVAANYAAMRAEMAKKIGLGHKSSGAAKPAKRGKTPPRS